MSPQHQQPWIPADRIDNIVQIEPALVILGLALGSWLIYNLLLRGLSPERHRNLRKLFVNLLIHVVTWVSITLCYFGLRQLQTPAEAVVRIASYVGLIALFWGATVVVKTCRILAFEYLFLGHMKVGVPVLLVNLLTLVLSIFLGGWIITGVFDIRLAPLLATSAIFSLVLGLAVQDTLGNLFAGIALQFDKPYEIGDWIEVNSGGQKWVGQVLEISWRATVLIGFSDETITIPNRLLSQAQISNFNGKDRPIVRSQLFRIPYGSDLAQVRKILADSIRGLSSVKKHPEPLVLFSEATDSWISAKLVYFIENFGSQYLIADEVLQAGVEALERGGISIASPRLLVRRDAGSQSPSC